MRSIAAVEPQRNHSGSRRNQQSGLRVWLRVLDEVLRAIEEAAWDTRQAVDRTWSVVRTDFRRLADQSRQHGARARRWPSDMGRLAATGWMLTKVASSYRFHVTAAAFMSRRAAARALARLHDRNARRFHATSVAQGGAFLKVGQMLSARPDLLPRPWIERLSTLQDAAPAFDYEDVVATIEEDLGQPLLELFESFEEEPVAAASIGQVHRAVTRDGQVVAVKVRRPGIESLIETDLALLELFLESMRSSLPPADYPTIVAEVRSMVMTELDYEQERESMRAVADFLDDVPRISAPHPIDSLSGPRVLTAAFAEGRKITDVLDELHADPDDDEAQARITDLLGLLLQSYVRQVCEAPLFQADPHPGNLLVTSDDELVVLDFGCSKPMPEARRRAYVGILMGFIAGDRDRMAELFAELGFGTRSGDPETLHTFADALLRQFRSASASGSFTWPTQEEVIEEAMRTLRAAESDPVERIPADFVMLARVFGTLGGLFMHYRPRVDFARDVLPTLARAMQASA